MARGVKRAKEMSEGSQDDVPGPSNINKRKERKEKQQKERVG